MFALSFPIFCRVFFQAEWPKRDNTPTISRESEYQTEANHFEFDDLMTI